MMLGIEDIDGIPSLEQPQAASLVPCGGTVAKEPYRVLWTEWSCLHFHRVKLQRPRDDNGRWDLWKVIRVRQVHVDGVPMMRLVFLQAEISELALSLNHVKTQQGGGRL